MTSAGPYENLTTATSAIDRALEAGQGVLQLAPAWVPRLFCTPGRRIRLHPDDYFPLGKDRGGIDERWLASAVRADNGPLTDPFEGLSLVHEPDGALLAFDEVIAHSRADLLGSVWERHQGWPMYSKFFDNQAPLPFHIHHRDEHAALVGKPGKPEAYYFSPQMNNHLGDFPFTFFGLHPETTREQVRAKLEAFSRGGDNSITELSVAYRIALGTGWDVPAGVLHAPASVCTYEPQAACDVYAMTESWSNNRQVPDELLWKDVPVDRHGDLEFILDLIDWDRNLDSRFFSNRFSPPVETSESQAEADSGAVEKWITYRSPSFSAKEFTLAPGATITMKDSAPYGLIVVAGVGKFGVHEIAAATTIRYGQFSSDEFFVSESSAREGVRITNHSTTSDLVLLKHFGPGNPQLDADAELFSSEELAR